MQEQETIPREREKAPHTLGLPLRYPFTFAFTAWARSLIYSSGAYGAEASEDKVVLCLEPVCQGLSVRTW